MGKISWTDKQQEVIDTRDHNILVSAAAGSGKTAVLVARIVDRITGENAVDVDRMLVVTFTKAAAAEMRERIGLALEELKEERQQTLLHNAQITTIDSFCLFVVRNYFEEIHLDPNFRIADTGEIKLLEADILGELFEEKYKEDSVSFLNLIDAYSGKRNDANVRDMVLKIYHQSASDSWPREWMQGLAKLYDARTKEELLHSKIMDELCGYCNEMLKDAKESLTYYYDVAKTDPELSKYVKTLEGDLALFEDSYDDYESLYQFFSHLSFANMGAAGKNADPQKKELILGGRNQIKDQLKGIREKYFLVSLEELLEQLKRMQPYVLELVDLSLAFYDKMVEEKAKLRIADFSDIEHFALRIFVDEQTKEPTAVARDFRDHFVEIMIDEYQDSNQVQEDILTAIARNDNMFMVGDVKQSIYRFRLARPELFMSKYEAYAAGKEDCKRIDLHHNFRSRKEVVSFTNDIFFKIMQKDLGAVTYDESASLHFGASYLPENEKMEAEVLLYTLSDEEETLELEASKKELEAKMVANKIKQMMKTTLVTDKKTGELRPMRYSDVVILFRSLKEWGDSFANVLNAAGVPCHVESSTGYFSAYEVQCVLNYLRILDNPYQDIPLAAVLKSPMVGLSDEDLAEYASSDSSFCESVLRSAKEEGSMLSSFYQTFLNLRSQMKDTPIHELLKHIISETGFLNYVAAMPSGEKRVANLEMLYEKAIEYESTSYKGLFHFIRYIDELQKYDVDFGEADVLGEGEDVVCIMTIHKSKGLEFPVVFVSGMSKGFNQMDTKDTLVIHPLYGLGVHEKTINPKTKRSCFVREEIADCIKRENLGEELRILYVALTRAKEKLILTGTISSIDKFYQSIVGKKGDCPLTYGQRVNANSYLDWVAPAMMSYDNPTPFQFVSASDLVSEEAKVAAEQEVERISLKEQLEQAKEMELDFSYVYPYEEEKNKKSKYSVSELKHQAMEDLEAEKMDFLVEEERSYVPKFARASLEEKEVNYGALRGTAVHRVMECISYKDLLSFDVTDSKKVMEFLEEEIKRMRSAGLISDEMISLVSKKKVCSFLESSVAQRMAKADKEGLLFKEKPFVMDYEGALLQGIIDVFWLEGDNLILLDYKTDCVDNGEELIRRYKTQLDLYADALSRVFSDESKTRITKECIIYSFRLQEVITL